MRNVENGTPLIRPGFAGPPSRAGGRRGATFAKSPRRRFGNHRVRSSLVETNRGVSTMTIYEPSLDEAALPSDEAEHVRTYRKFVHYMTAGACAVPVLVAFALYWMK